MLSDKVTYARIYFVQNVAYLLHEIDTCVCNLATDISDAETLSECVSGIFMIGSCFSDNVLTFVGVCVHVMAGVWALT